MLSCYSTSRKVGLCSILQKAQVALALAQAILQPPMVIHRRTISPYCPINVLSSPTLSFASSVSCCSCPRVASWHDMRGRSPRHGSLVTGLLSSLFVCRRLSEIHTCLIHVHRLFSGSHDHRWRGAGYSICYQGGCITPKRQPQGNRPFT